MSYKVPVYGLYENGVLVDKGSARELEARYYYSTGKIAECARKGWLLDRKYTVRKIEDEERENIEGLDERIIDLISKGVTTHKLIAERLSVSSSTIDTHIKKLREEGRLK